MCNVSAGFCFIKRNLKTKREQMFEKVLTLDRY